MRMMNNNHLLPAGRVGEREGDRHTRSGVLGIPHTVLMGLALCFVLEQGLYAQENQETGGIGQAVEPDTDDSLRRSKVPGLAGLPVHSDAVSFGELLAGDPGIYMTETGSTGQTPQLMIRGVNTVNLYATPYVFVDGVPVRYTRTLNPFLSVYEPTRFGFVNPNDIREVVIARNGKALSGIGGRGANGAVYLVTDRGAFGGTRVDFTASHGFLTGDYSAGRMGAGEFKDYLRDYMIENGTSEEELSQNPLFDHSLPQYNNNTDWMDLVSRNARFNDYHVKLKGGDADANYMFSVGYTGKEETLEGAGLERVSMRFNLDYKLSPRFEISNNLSYANVTSDYLEQGPDWGIHPVFVSATKAPFFNPYAYTEAGALTRSPAGVDELGKSNPVSLVNSMNNDNEENRVDGLIKAQWTASDQLALHSMLAVNYYNRKEQQYRPASGIVSHRNRVRQNAKRNSSEFTLLSNTWLEKNGTWGSRSRYTGKLGFWAETYEEKSVYARKINAGTDDYETLEQGTVDSTSNVEFESNLMMFYLRGEVDVLDRVALSANVNVEGSSNFGPEGRWNIYPGVKGVADLLDRSARHGVSVRAGWGRSGNNDLRGYYHHNLYYPANYFGYGGVYLGNVANESIKPEITDTYDAGITFSLFNQRLLVDGGYYYKHTKDLITYRAVPIEVGLDPQFENSGSVVSQGIEVGFDARLLDKNGFSWQAYGNLSTLKSEVKELPNGDIIRTLGNISGIAREAEALGAFYGYKVLGVFRSESEVNLNKADGTSYRPGDYIIEDIDGDGRINELDRQVIGSALPDFFGGFGTVVGYKRFSLNALFTFSSGNDIYNSFNQQMHVMKDYSNQSPAVAWRWKSEAEPGNGLSRAALDDPSSNGAASDLWVEDGSYLRLKQVTLSYEIPVQGKLRFLRGLRVYLTGENMLTFTDYSGSDPEVVTASDPLLRGIDFGASPVPRSFLLGLKASF